MISLRSAFKRCWVLVTVLTVAALGLSVAPVAGQASPFPLVPGQPTNNTFNENTFAQIYVFEGVGGDEARVTVTNGDGMILGMIMSDVEGGVVTQARDTDADGTVEVVATLPATGNYFITVLPVAAGEAPVEGSYQILLETSLGTAQAAPAAETAPPAAATVQPTPTEAVVQVPDPTTPAAAEPVTQPAVAADVTVPAFETPLVTTTGLQVTLQWNTTADMDLEVRDPVGGALFAGNPNVPSGGQFGANVNGGCQNVTAASPTEQANWNAGEIPSGSYEVLVYYQEGCENTAPVPFVVNVTYDGAQLTPIQGTLLPGQVYIGSFEIEPVDGTDTAVAETRLFAGVKGEEILPTSAAVLISEAEPIAFNQPVVGLITNDRPYQSYSFDAQADTPVTITLNAQNGSLDTYVALLDPSGNLLFFNDDAGPGVTDSVLNNAVLTTPGTYTIVATRYGLSVGGTEGYFTLTLSGAGETVAAALDPASLGATPQTGQPQLEVTPVLDVPTQAPAAQQPGLPTIQGVPPEIQALGLPNGFIEVTLVWNSGADLQLLVRDPLGEAVFDDEPIIQSGGRLELAGNVACTPAETATPVSYIYWPVQPPPGAYEIDIWFQNTCDDPTPISFNLFVTINGQPLLTETVTPSTPFFQGDHFITSITIDELGNVIPGEGGVTGLETLAWQAEVPNAVPISDGDVINDIITLDNRFDLYAFEGTAGEFATITMNAAPGTNLDPNLYLIAPSGVVAAQNDDAEPGVNINSRINNFTLPEDGQYIIIATHYGERFGVSTGAYTLTLDQ